VKKKIYIIKIGGHIIDDASRLQEFLTAFAALGEYRILVHGGGKLATRLAGDLGIPQQMVEGRRITDAETLRIVTMVYAGLVNKSIVASLQGHRCNAIGLSGADGDLIRSDQRGAGALDYGFVGDVKRVNAGLLGHLIENGYTPVIAPITHDGKGQLLNTNADTIAQETATALAEQYEVCLVYAFEKKGVLADVDDEDSAIPRLDPGAYERYRSEGRISAGMIPKLDNAFSAIRAGVHQVIIGKAEELGSLVCGDAGTTLTHA
jgi:acetylglutamate kinase